MLLTHPAQSDILLPYNALMAEFHIHFPISDAWKHQTLPSFSSKFSRTLSHRVCRLVPHQILFLKIHHLIRVPKGTDCWHQYLTALSFSHCFPLVQEFQTENNIHLQEIETSHQGTPMLPITDASVSPASALTMSHDNALRTTQALPSKNAPPFRHFRHIHLPSA